jgi:hypothetical protein
MATKDLDNWAPEWHDGDSRILTLKKRLETLENLMSVGHSDTSSLSSSVTNLEDNIQTLMRNQSAMTNHINLIHLCLAKKITPD